jgi:hypothetical protein
VLDAESVSSTIPSMQSFLKKSPREAKFVPLFNPKLHLFEKFQFVSNRESPTLTLGSIVCLRTYAEGLVGGSRTEVISMKAYEYG